MQKTTNNFNIRYNRFQGKTRFEPVTIKKFNFERGLISKNSKELLFTNKASSENEQVYDDILSMYLRYIEGDITFLDEFQFDEIKIDYKSDRLLEIIKLIQKIKYKNNDLKNIFKLKHKENPELHFFIKRNKDNFTLLLIDLYHMAIYGTRIINGKLKPINMERIYKHNKNNECLLDNIKKIAITN